MRICLACIMLTASSLAWTQERLSVSPRLLKSSELPGVVEDDALERQFGSLAILMPRELEYSPRGPVRLIREPSGLKLPAHARELAKGSDAKDVVLPLFGDMLLARGSEDLRVKSNALIDANTRALRLSQFVRGIPVIQGLIAIDYNENSLQVIGMSANFVPDRNLPETPALSAQEAELVIPKAVQASHELRNTQLEIAQGTYLAYYASPVEAEQPQLVWVVRVMYGSFHELWFVNAVSGAIAGREQETHMLTQTIYNANYGSPGIPGGLVNAIKMSQSQINAEPQAKNAKDHINDAQEVWATRIPYSSASFPTDVHVAIKYIHQPPLPPYTATHQKIGSKDYLTFSPPVSGLNAWSKPRDIVVHELGHAIADRALTFGISNNWAPAYEPHALHEFFADLLATVVDVAHDGVSPDNTWRIGNGLFTGFADQGLRSWRYPLFDFFSPGHRNWYPTRSFAHSVSAAYANSTILGHAYYLSIFGGQNEDVANPSIPDITVTALGATPSDSEPIAREIFVRAIQDFSMAVEPSFMKLKSASMSVANMLYGTIERDKIKTAFEAVGICENVNTAPDAMYLTDLGDIMCAGRFFPSWPSIPGATRYYGEVAPAQFGFSLATPVTDVTGEINNCTFQVSQDSVFRMRACNGCGCGPWSQTYNLTFWSPCP